MPKSQRKKYSQFFTSKETAIFMAELFDILDKKALRRDGALTPTGEQFWSLAISTFGHFVSKGKVDYCVMVWYT